MDSPPLGDASPDSGGRRLLASEILIVSDAELDQFLQQFGPSDDDDTTYINIDGLDDLSASDQKAVVERLRARLRPAESLPIDLDLVNARLAQGGTSRRPRQPPSQSPSPRSFSLSPSVTSSKSRSSERERLLEELLQDSMKGDRIEHRLLVADGGRPFYPLRLLEDVCRNPKSHPDIVEFWDWSEAQNIFGMQRGRWLRFRDWQRDNRGGFDLEDEFRRYRDDMRYTAELLGQDTAEYDAENWREDYFRSQQRRRILAYRHTIEEGVSGKSGLARFRAYVKAAKARLARHGFAAPFKLQRDPLSQDALTTWAEYLNYEYWLYDQFFRRSEKFARQRDKAGETVLASGVLRPGEGLDTIVELEFGARLWAEVSAAVKTKSEAESTASAASDALWQHDEPSDRSELERILAEAQAQLAAATEAFEHSVRRQDLIVDFVVTRKHYNWELEQASRHEVLLRWILDQVPLIKVEMTDEATLESQHGEKRKRREHNDVPVEVGEHRRHEASAAAGGFVRTRAVTKRLMEGAAGAATKATETTTNGRQSKRRSAKGRKAPLIQHLRAGTGGQSTPLVPLRRSARLAARQQNSGPGSRPKGRKREGKV